MISSDITSELVKRRKFISEVSVIGDFDKVWGYTSEKLMEAHNAKKGGGPERHVAYVFNDTTAECRIALYRRLQEKKGFEYILPAVKNLKKNESHYDKLREFPRVVTGAEELTCAACQNFMAIGDEEREKRDGCLLCYKCAPHRSSWYGACRCHHEQTKLEEAEEGAARNTTKRKQDDTPPATPTQRTQSDESDDPPRLPKKQKPSQPSPPSTPTPDANSGRKQPSLFQRDAGDLTDEPPEKRGLNKDENEEEEQDRGERKRRRAESEDVEPGIDKADGGKRIKKEPID